MTCGHEQRLEELERRVETLLGRVVALEAETKRLRAENARLQAENTELRSRLGMNSSNSSKPPSSDGPSGPVRAKRESSGRGPGGQPGHKKHERAMLPAERVDRFRDYRPELCTRCDHALPTADAYIVRRHQVIEVPEVRAEVTEHRAYACRCPRCDHVTTREFALAVPRGQLGPRLMAVVTLLSGRYRLSRREVGSVLDEVFGVELSLGSIANVCATAADAMAAPVAEVAAAVARATVVNADETGFKCAGAKGWLWCAVLPASTLFLLSNSRAALVARQMLAGFGGVLGSDRWNGYNWYDLERRQLCWAHLKRNLIGLSERGPEAATFARSCLRLLKKTFKIWHRNRDDPPEHLRRMMLPTQDRWRTLFEAHRDCECAKTRAFARQMTKNWDALWTFVRLQGVEPTNNAAERALRPAVLWRKGSFGTQSDTGARFVERMLTVSATCKQQRRSVFAYLTDLFNARLSLAEPPRLLPSP